jgi:hypothetical protein
LRPLRHEGLEVSAAPALKPEPSGAPMTVIFDPRSNFAGPPNLLGLHPGASMLKGWLTQRLAPLAIRKRLKPGWHVRLDNYCPGRAFTGALRDRNDKDLITFEIVSGHHL